MIYRPGTLLRQIAYRRAMSGDISLIVDVNDTGSYRLVTVRADGHFGTVCAVQERVLDTDYIVIGATHCVDELVGIAKKVKTDFANYSLNKKENQ